MTLTDEERNEKEMIEKEEENSFLVTQPCWKMVAPKRMSDSHR